MLQRYCFVVFVVCIFSFQSYAQGDYITSKEGRSILNRRQVINNCLKGMKKDKSNRAAVSICECQVNKIDRYFTAKQYRENTRQGVIDIGTMIKKDSVLEKQMNACYTNSGVSVLLQAEGFEEEFVASCITSVNASTERSIDAKKVNSFCNCQLSMVKGKKLTDAQMESLSNPNSLLFYEMMYTCGDPFETSDNINRGWSASSASDINGPNSDTIRVLTLNGLSYIQIKTGSMVQFWLLDTGASDMLVNKDMEETLKAEGLIGQSNYLGTAEYEMANGMIDTCRRYQVNNIQVGSFSLDNIIIAVTDKGKKVIAGKGMLNKFTTWYLNNKENTLVLSK
ncbi:retropepsin-like aspartic protease [Aridibaculum aurantiacum]|uniref:retropepsin-like aspartic protease n=1 Tax=Aridibaculum aurantiacum TaxID=2810307 RepID=UPI001A959C10|nr:retropepsin-like aspartic protease [Aridibaculum aurantiacum]